MEKSTPEQLVEFLEDSFFDNPTGLEPNGRSPLQEHLGKNCEKATEWLPTDEQPGEKL